MNILPKILFELRCSETPELNANLNRIENEEFAEEISNF
jgi:hypothetical protein